MAEPIYMRVGEGNTIDLPVLVGAMGDFLGLLREVDSAVAERRSGNLKWRVTTLSNDPSPLVGVTPVMRHAVIDTSERVEREVIRNVGSLTERGERNRYLSDRALSRVERIAQTAPSIGPSSIYTDTSKDFSLTTIVTTKTLSQVQELTSEKSISFGSLKGSLDSISVHRGKEFRVWDEETKRPVRCFFAAPKLEVQAKELLGMQVVVTGMMKADRHGRPISMRVETLDPLSEPTNLPTIEQMAGLVPNFTGGLSMREFFEDFD